MAQSLLAAQNMRHAILGLGGVGGLVGALLARAGDEVTAVVRAETLSQYPPQLSLESPRGSMSVPLRLTTSVKGPFDILWIAVKATHLEEALTAVPDASRIGAVVPLLNGIDHLALLRSRFGDERVVPATIAVESERVAPGRIVQRSPFVRLNVSSRGQTRLTHTIESLSKLGVTARFVADEATLMWSKLVFLAPVALTTSASGKTAGEITSDSTWRTRMERSAAEATAVGRASGAILDSAVVVQAVVSLPAGFRSSMQKDVAAGREPELDAIAGPIVRGALRHGIDVPVTRELVDMVRRELARGARTKR
jgi:2-dehydropantoate 2-reductase